MNPRETQLRTQTSPFDFLIVFLSLSCAYNF